MRRLLFSLIFALILSAGYHPGLAAPTFQVTEKQVEYTFGGQVTLRAKILSDQPLEEVLVFIRSEGDVNTFVGSASVDQGELVYTHDLTNQPLRAFSRVEYWFGITPQGGQAYTTEPGYFYYDDNRFAWKILQQGPFLLHWYDGDLAYAQMLLDTAQAGLIKIQELLAIPPPDEVMDIYAYASSEEMQSTLRLAGLNWVAGRADPDLGVIFISIPVGPGQRQEAERQIPHELMHIMMYQAAGASYKTLPTWYKEGLASITELKPDPDYTVILLKSYEKNALIPLSSLCDRFPADVASVRLAYAEAADFARYLYHQYGSQGLQALLSSYSEGMGCERGTELALGESLTQLERQWRRVALGESPWLTAFENLSPWLTLLIVSLAAPLALTLGNLFRRKSASQQNPA